MSTLFDRAHARRATGRTLGIVSRMLLACGLAAPLLGTTIAFGGVASAHGATRPTVVQATVTPYMHEVAQNTTLLGGNTGPATATCPTGEFALGGGWSIPSGPNYRVYSATLYGNTWSVYVTHPAVSGVLLPLSVTAYVECIANATGATIIARGVVQTAQPNSFNTMSVFCNTGETPVGFGFDLSSAGSKLELQAANAETFESVVWWNFWVYNHDTVARTIIGYVNCLSNVTATQSPMPGTRAVSVYPAYLGQAGGYVYANQTETDVAACPSGYQPAGGGLDYKGANQGIGIGNIYSLHASTAGWQGSTFSVTTYGLVPIMPAVWAMCLGFV